MKDYSYIENFKGLGFGMFVHFGLYSVLGKGEWYLFTKGISAEEYNGLAARFNPDKDWAKNLVATAKDAGCRYITLTTRHHDGFSLYDTCGLTEFDAVHAAAGRDLITEFVDECNAAGIIPFLYHTLLDWYNPDYKENFPAYIDYLIKSVEILCTRYGKIGGLWFDGMWDDSAGDWQIDRLYSTIRAQQPTAMIINNTGLSEEGKVGHFEVDSVTFERGTPCPVVTDGKPVAGEVCQGVTDHWGYCEDDVCYKTVPSILELLVDCRKYGHNLLLNVGIRGDGSITPIERDMLRNIGKVLRVNEGIIRDGKPAGIEAENADIFTDGRYYYAVIKDVPMSFNTNVTRMKETKRVVLKTDKRIKNAVWLDNGEEVQIDEDGSFFAWPFDYGTSYYLRVAKFELE